MSERYIVESRDDYSFSAAVLDTHSFDLANEPDCICMCFDSDEAVLIARKLNAIENLKRDLF